MKFLLAIDAPNWACHRFALGLQNEAAKYGHECTISVRNLSQQDEHDAILWFGWYESPWDSRMKVTRPIAAFMTSEGQAWKGPDVDHKRGLKVPWPSQIATFHRSLRSIDKLKQYDAMFCNSEIIYGTMLGRHRKLFLVVAGVDCDLFPFVERPEKSKIDVGWSGNAGGKTPSTKGRWLLNRVIEETQDVANWHVLDSSHIEDNRVAFEDMPAWYAGIDVLAVTSVSDGTPCPALEAAATGANVVGTRVGIMSQLCLDENLHQIPTCDVEGKVFQDWLVGRLRQDQMTHHYDGDRTHSNAVVRFGWDVRAPAYFDALEQLAERRWKC